MFAGLNQRRLYLNFDVVCREDGAFLSVILPSGAAGAVSRGRGGLGDHPSAERSEGAKRGECK